LVGVIGADRGGERDAPLLVLGRRDGGRRLLRCDRGGEEERSCDRTEHARSIRSSHGGARRAVQHRYDGGAVA